MQRRCKRVINSLAPMRICDFGGWTDTWFAGRGKVLNFAVYPYAEVQMRTFDRSDRRPQISIYAENYGQRYQIDTPEGTYEKHPLLEAAIDYMGIPDDVEVDFCIYSEAPAGCSTGTSAAVSVAMLGAMDWLTPGRMTPHEVALAAQEIETKLLGQQCGIQDQLASAYGGISYLDMYSYPNASVSRVSISEPLWWELEARLSLIFVGSSHSSSSVHEMVIRGLEEAGPDAAQLRPLRETPVQARDALYAGDLDALGRAMIANNEAQRALHADLIGPHHQRIIDVAREFDALGWKVNGAGGDGGSVTILGGHDRAEKRAMIRAIESADAKYRHIPVHLSRSGLRVWESAVRP